jgi:hypothetical protein
MESPQLFNHVLIADHRPPNEKAHRESDLSAIR